MSTERLIIRAKAWLSATGVIPVDLFIELTNRGIDPASLED